MVHVESTHTYVQRTNTTGVPTLSKSREKIATANSPRFTKVSALLLLCMKFSNSPICIFEGMVFSVFHHFNGGGGCGFG